MKIIKNKMKKEKWNMLPTELTNDTSISNDAKMLWIKLWNSNKGKGKYKEWQPTIEGLATIFKVDKSTVKRWKKELDDSGWITSVGSRNDITIHIHFSPVLGVKNETNVGVKNETLY